MYSVMSAGVRRTMCLPRPCVVTAMQVSRPLVADNIQINSLRAMAIPQPVVASYTVLELVVFPRMASSSATYKGSDGQIIVNAVRTNDFRSRVYSQTNHHSREENAENHRPNDRCSLVVAVHFRRDGCIHFGDGGLELLCRWM